MLKTGGLISGSVTKVWSGQPEVDVSAPRVRPRNKWDTATSCIAASWYVLLVILKVLDGNLNLRLMRGQEIREAWRCVDQVFSWIWTTMSSTGLYSQGLTRHTVVPDRSIRGEILTIERACHVPSVSSRSLRAGSFIASLPSAPTCRRLGREQEAWRDRSRRGPSR